MIRPEQTREGASKQQTTQKQSTKKTTASKAKTPPAKENEMPKQSAFVKSKSKVNSSPASFTEVFTSTALTGLVLMLIVAFNVVVLKNSFLLAVPAAAFSGDIQLDALLYGMAMSVLMVIILFHEENWHNPFCAGAVTLYLDALILVLYMRWFEALIGAWGSIWLMSGIMTLIPVIGLFIMVLMLKSKEKSYA